MTRDQEFARASTPAEFKALMQRWQAEDAARDAAKAPQPAYDWLAWSKDINGRLAHLDRLVAKLDKEWDLLGAYTQFQIDQLRTRAGIEPLYSREEWQDMRPEWCDAPARERIRIKAWRRFDPVSGLFERRTALQLRLLTSMTNAERAPIEAEVRAITARLEQEMTR